MLDPAVEVRWCDQCNINAPRVNLDQCSQFKSVVNLKCPTQVSNSGEATSYCWSSIWSVKSHVHWSKFCSKPDPTRCQPITETSPPCYRWRFLCCPARKACRKVNSPWLLKIPTTILITSACSFIMHLGQITLWKSIIRLKVSTNETKVFSPTGDRTVSICINVQNIEGIDQSVYTWSIDSVDDSIELDVTWRSNSGSGFCFL